METTKPKKKRMTALQRHLSEIGRKGGQSTLKKHGKEHFKKAGKTRWGEEAK